MSGGLLVDLVALAQGIPLKQQHLSRGTTSRNHKFQDESSSILIHCRISIYYGSSPSECFEICGAQRPELARQGPRKETPSDRNAPHVQNLGLKRSFSTGAISAAITFQHLRMICGSCGYRNKAQAELAGISCCELRNTPQF